MFHSFFSAWFNKYNLTLREYIALFLQNQVFQRKTVPFENEQTQMILNIIQMSSRNVQQIKVLSNDISDLSINATWTDMVYTFRKTGHSRLPVYENDNGRKDYIGFIHAKFLLFQKFDKSKIPVPSIKKYINPLLFVPETQKLLSLLNDMKSNRSHLVLTVNEYGEVTGLITLENILEEIVGDIHDEFDPFSKRIQKVGQRTYKVQGSVPLTHLNKLLSTNLPEEKFNTIAGYFLHESNGRLKKGFEITHASLSMKIEQFSKHQVETVLITLHHKPQ